MNDVPIIIYRCWLATFTAMSPEAVGYIMKDLSNRIMSGDPLPELPEGLEILSNKIYGEVLAELEKYEAKREKNRQNVKGRWGKSNVCSTDEVQTYNERNTNVIRTNGNTNTNTNTTNTKVLESKKTAARFIPPSVEEVRAYCQERKNSVNPEQFVDFYSSKGWKIGNQTMKDWKAAVRTWEKRENFTSSPKRGTKTGSDAGITYLGTSDRGVSVSGTSGENNTTGKHEDIFDLFG